MTNYRQELTTLRTCIYELQERYDKLLLEYRQSCLHLEVEHIKKNHKVGYYYSESTDLYCTCKDCGYQETKHVTHNSGFE